MVPDLHVCGVPPRIRTENLRIKSPERTVHTVRFSGFHWVSVQILVRLVRFGVSQSVEFGAKLGAKTMGVIRRSSVRAGRFRLGAQDDAFVCRRRVCGRRSRLEGLGR